ncbi:Dbl homology domain-containing protein [Fennellomyces sp. T-0311]|nr:Dbl homology domain-containing protein [Fennellomyces sp. T-0311]
MLRLRYWPAKPISSSNNPDTPTTTTNQDELPPWRRQSADVIVRVESNSTLSSLSSVDDVSTRSSSVSSLPTPQDEHAVMPMPSCSTVLPDQQQRKWELRPRAKTTQKKEAEAISVWRDTSAKLNSERFTSQQDAALCRHIIRELYHTEQSYNRLLVLIQTRYMLPMMTKTKHASLLFAHLDALLAFSNRIMQGVRQGNVAKLFIDLEQDMVVFLKYAVHYEANIKAIRRVCATNAVFLKIEQDGLRRRDTNRMGFADYLIAPFQRIPRYCLLIKDLMKHYPQRSDNNLDKALKMLKGLAAAMDHTQKLP